MSWFNKYKYPTIIVIITLVIGLILLKPHHDKTPSLKPNQIDSKAEIANFKPIILNGVGTRLSKSFYIPSGGYKITLNYKGSSNFMVDMINREGQSVTYGLANEIGSTKFTKGVRIDNDCECFMSVETGENSGKWSIEIHQL